MSALNTIAGGCGSAAHRITCYRDGRKTVHRLDELDRLAAGLAAHFQSIGLRTGDRVGVIAKNSLEWVLIDLAAIKLGVVVAAFEYGKFEPSATMLAKYDLRHLYSESSPVAPHERIHAVHDITHLASAASGAVTAMARYEPDDVVALKFTSGSTGEPKGLGASAGSIDASLAAVQAMFEHGAKDNILIFLPLSLLQQRYWVYSALVYGHDVTVTSAELVFGVAREIQPTVIMGVPGFYEVVKRRVEMQEPDATTDLSVRRAEIGRLLGSRLRYCWTGSAPAPYETLKFFNDCAVALYEGYGMNETCIVTKNCPTEFRLGSVGKVLPHKKLRLDADGVIIVSSQFPVGRHYTYCQPGDSERIFQPNGDVWTGDVGHIDDDGFLYIHGRADDVIVLSNGRNVAVRRIEEMVKTHPAVTECILYGAGKPFLTAVISPVDPSADGAEIRAHVATVNDGLAEAEQILRSVIVPEHFSIANGLLTSQYKPKRKDIYGRYRAIIEPQLGESDEQSRNNCSAELV